MKCIIVSVLTCTDRQTGVRPGLSGTVRARLPKQVETELAPEPDVGEGQEVDQEDNLNEKPVGRLPGPSDRNDPPVSWNFNRLAGTKN